MSATWSTRAGLQDGDYLVRDGDGFRRAVMSDLNRAVNRELYVWREGRAVSEGRPWDMTEWMAIHRATAMAGR